MNQKYNFICTAVIFVLGMPSLLSLGVPFLDDGNITATIHGGTFAGDTLERLNDTLVNINSNPSQSIVAKNGVYSFELVPGDYTITASYYHNNTLIYSREANLKVEDGGNYVFDLLLYPASGDPVTGPTENKTNDSNSMNPIEQPEKGNSTLSLLPIALVLLLIIGGSYKYFTMAKLKGKNRSQEGKFGKFRLPEKVYGKRDSFEVSTEFDKAGGTITSKRPEVKSVNDSEMETASLKKLPLSDELREILNIIKIHNGRITQKDLRSKMDYSEVKVSLMLSELEKRGFVKKFKKGRENIVILIDKER